VDTSATFDQEATAELAIRLRQGMGGRPPPSARTLSACCRSDPRTPGLSARSSRKSPTRAPSGIRGSKTLGSQVQRVVGDDRRHGISVWDFAYAVGRNRFTVPGPDGKPHWASHGNGLTIWHKDPTV